MRVTRRASAAALAAALLVGGARAAADDLPSAPSDCTVNRKCSSSGVACVSTDAKCMSDATGRGLEVFCEDGRATPTTLVYCPANTGRAESRVIWIFLAAAASLAIGGGVVAFVVLKKKA